LLQGASPALFAKSPTDRKPGVRCGFLGFSFSSGVTGFTVSHSQSPGCGGSCYSQRWLLGRVDRSRHTDSKSDVRCF